MAIKEVTNSAEAQAIMPQVTRLQNSLDTFKVNSTGTWLEAAEKIKMVKDKIKEIKAVRKDFLDPINELKEVTLGFFEPALTKLDQILIKLEKTASEWKNEQLERERIAQEKVEAEAREKERFERDRLRKEAEVKEAEAREAQRKAEELARKDNFEKAERARIEAERLRQEANTAKQESKEVEIEAKDVKQKVEKVDGLFFRRYYKAEIIDAKKIPREFLKPDEVAINKYVSDNKENAKIPGVRVYFVEKSVSQNGG